MGHVFTVPLRDSVAARVPDREDSPASLFADTWELPAPAEPGGTGPGELDSFTISPSTIPLGTSLGPIVLEVRLKSPKPDPVRVFVQTTGASGLSPIYKHHSPTWNHRARHAVPDAAAI